MIAWKVVLTMDLVVIVPPLGSSVMTVIKKEVRAPVFEVAAAEDYVKSPRMPLRINRPVALQNSKV